MSAVAEPETGVETVSRPPEYTAGGGYRPEKTPKAQDL